MTKRKRQELTSGEITPSMISGITLAKPKPPKTSKWDRYHQTQLHSYRGIPPELHKKLVDIAANYGVSVGDIARLFLEYGLKAYTAKELSVMTMEIPGKRIVVFED